MFVLEFTFSEERVDVLNGMDFVFTCFEVFPNGVVSRGSRVITNDFTNERFPSVRSVVHSVIERFGNVARVSGVITRV